MPPLADLLARLREAASGSEDLDCAIHHWRRPEVTLKPEAWDLRYRQQIPHYTRSLDAAVALVPTDEKTGERYDWIVGCTNGGMTIHAQVGPKISVERNLLELGHKDDGDARMRFADTAPLALCIAALTARQETSDAE